MRNPSRFSFLLALITRIAAADPEPPRAFAVAGEHGFGLRSETGFELDLHLVLATDARAFLGELPAMVTDRSTAVVRTSALQLDARIYRRLRVVTLANAVDTRAPVSDAWMELEVSPALRVRVGKFPFPISAERLTPPLLLPFVGPSAAALVLPPRDTGLQLLGTSRWLDANVALVNGAVAGGTGDADTDGGKDLVGRLLVKLLPPAPGRELGVGLGASWGRHRGTLAAPGVSVLRTYGGQVFFAPRADVALADGDLVRVVPHAVLAHGVFGLQLDAVLAREELATGRVTTRAASAIATVALTGEPVRPLGFVVPRRPLGGEAGGIGALLAVVGAGQIAIDPEVFPATADPTVASRRFRVLGGGLKWYPVAGLAVLLDYGHQWFAGRRPAEDTVVARVQVIL